MTGAFGVFGYTGKGVIKSLDVALHQKTAKAVLEAKRAEERYMTLRHQDTATENKEITWTIQQALEDRFSRATEQRNPASEGHMVGSQ